MQTHGYFVHVEKATNMSKCLYDLRDTRTKQEVIIREDSQPCAESVLRDQLSLAEHQPRLKYD